MANLYAKLNVNKTRSASTGGRWARIGRATGRAVGSGAKLGGKFVVFHFIFIAVILVVALVVVEIFKEAIEIEPIQVPQALSNEGYSPRYVAEELQRRLSQIIDIAAEQQAIIPIDLEGIRGDVQIPGGGPSVQAVAEYLRGMIKRPNTRISGQITGDKDSPLVLHLRVRRTGMRYLRVPSAEAEKCEKPGEDQAEPGPPKPILEEKLDALLGPAACGLAWALQPEALSAYYRGTGQEEKATETAERIAREKARRAAQVHVRQASFSNRAGDFDRAIEESQAAVEMQPDNAAAYYNWGNALESKGEYDAAIEKYQKAVELDPDYTSAYNNWGVALRAKGEYDEAIEKYQMVIEIDPIHKNAYNNWGFALNNKGDYDAAIEKLQKAIAIDSSFAYPYKNWGLSLFGMGDIDGAVAKFNEALRLKPDFPKAFAGLGEALERKGDRAGAIRAYEQAMQGDPKEFGHLAERIERLRAP